MCQSSLIVTLFIILHCMQSFFKKNQYKIQEWGYLIKTTVQSYMLINKLA